MCPPRPSPDYSRRLGFLVRDAVLVRDADHVGVRLRERGVALRVLLGVGPPRDGVALAVRDRDAVASLVLVPVAVAAAAELVALTALDALALRLPVAVRLCGGLLVPVGAGEPLPLGGGVAVAAGVDVTAALTDGEADALPLVLTLGEGVAVPDADSDPLADDVAAGEVETVRVGAAVPLPDAPTLGVAAPVRVDERVSGGEAVTERLTLREGDAVGALLPVGDPLGGLLGEQLALRLALVDTAGSGVADGVTGSPRTARLSMRSVPAVEYADPGLAAAYEVLPGAKICTMRQHAAALSAMPAPPRGTAKLVNTPPPDASRTAMPTHGAAGPTRACSSRKREPVLLACRSTRSSVGA